MQNQHFIGSMQKEHCVSDADSMPGCTVKLKGDANAYRDHLTLRLVRLKRSEAWPNQGAGFSFVLAKAGSGQYVSPAAQQRLQPGDVLVLNSADGGKIEVAGDEMIFWCFSVCFEHLFPLFAIGEICMLQNTTGNFNGSKLYAASGSLAQECHRLVEAAPPQGNVDHRSQMLRVVAAVLTVEFKNARSQRGRLVRMEDHMMQVFEELSATELLTLSVGDMAHKFGCSRRHLNRLFHQHFGCSVASLRMEMRLLKALALLRVPSVKIINVAEQCGFNHLGLFNACFKKRFGNTPGRWRKGASNEENPVSDLDVGHPSCPMHAHGLCPYTPKADDRIAIARKTSSTQNLSGSSGPANPKLRESILRNIHAVSAQMARKSGSEIKLQNRP
jgi:AraC-like DNA-binding protein